MSIDAFIGPQPVWQGFDGNGIPLAGGKIFTYYAGTSTMQDTYTDAFAGVTATNPVILDSTGRATLWFGKQAYKLIITSSDGTLDPVTLAPLTGVIISTTDNYLAEAGSSLQIVSTIAYLKELPSTSQNSGSMVYVQGYNAAGDGGGGMFLWVPSQSNFDGGMTISPNDLQCEGGWVRQPDDNSFIDVKWYGADPTGTTNARSAILAADTYANYNGASTYISAGTYKVTSTMTCVAPMTFADTGRLQWTTGTVTVRPIINDIGYHFNATQGLVVPQGTTVRPEWFGSSVGTGSDDTVALAVAFGSLVSGGTVLLEAKAYITLAYQTLQSYVTVRGQGYNSIIQMKASNTTTYLLQSTSSVSGVTIENLSLQGNTSNSSHVGGILIWGTNCTVRNCLIFGTAFDGICIGSSTITSSNCSIHDNLIQNCGTAGTYESIRIVAATDTVIENNDIQDAASLVQHGISIEPTVAANIGNLTINNNNMWGCNISYNATNTAQGTVQITNNTVTLNTVTGLATPFCIAVVPTGPMVIDRNILSPNLIYGGIHVSQSGLTSYYRCSIKGNVISISSTLSSTTDTSGGAHSGIVIDSLLETIVNVCDNRVVNLTGDTTLPYTLTGSYGITETGTVNAQCVIYGMNTISGYALPIYTTAARFINLGAQADIGGSGSYGLGVNIAGALTASGSLATAGYINGLSIQPVVHSTAYDSITISPGVAADLASNNLIGLTSGITKGLISSNAFMNWTSGNTVNKGLSPAISAAAGWYNVFVFVDSSKTIVEFGIDRAANINPTSGLIAYAHSITGLNYPYWRRIGSIYVKNIGGTFSMIPVNQTGDEFFYSSADWAAETTISLPGNSWTYADVNLTRVPSGVRTIAKINYMVVTSGCPNIDVFLGPTNTTEYAGGVSGLVFPWRHSWLTSNGGFTGQTFGKNDVPTDTSGNINYQAYTGTTGSGSLQFCVLGWHDFRGKDGL